MSRDINNSHADTWRNTMINQNESSLIQVSTQGDQLVVDSRLIAAQLEISHKAFAETIRKYQIEMEQDFGRVPFKTEVGKRAQGGGNPEKIYYLNEDQALYIMTLSRNTDAVRKCKRELVKAFSNAKKIIPQQSERIQELQLENENLKLKAKENDRQDLRIALHGVPTTLLLEGKQDSVVTVAVPTLEVINQNTNVKFSGQTLVQVAETMLRLYGIKFKSGADVKRWLIEMDKHDLISQAQRSVSSDYIPDEYLKEVYAALRQCDRQLKLGE